MITEGWLFAPLYVVFFALIAILYLIGAFILGVLGAALTFPVLYYSGYGLVPPSHTPANTNTRIGDAAIVQLALGGVFGAASVVVVFFVDQTIPFGLQYQFARVSARLETVPALAFGISVVLVVWLGYLFYRREEFVRDARSHQKFALLASIRATTVFGICFLGVAILSTFTLYL